MLTCLDRFVQGFPDAQDAPPVTFCDCCAKEIYPDEIIYSVQGAVVHLECFERFAADLLEARQMAIEDAIA